MKKLKKKKLTSYAIGGTVKQKSYNEEMYDTMNLVPFSDLKASQSNKVQDLTKLAQGVTMLGQMASSIGGMMGSGSNGTAPTEEVDMTGGDMNNFNGSAQIAAYGGKMGNSNMLASLMSMMGLNQEDPIGKKNTQVKKKEFVPATRRDSINLQKNYKVREGELKKQGYRKLSSEDGSFNKAHQEMYSNYEDILKREKSGKNTEIIQKGQYRVPGIYPSSVYRENNINGNPELYKTQEAIDIGVLNPNVPYALFDKRIAPTKKDVYINDLYGDQITNYGYNFGEEYDVPKSKGTGKKVTVNKTTMRRPINKVGVTRPSDRMAMGGGVPGTPVEVEGQEVGETPQGNLMQFKGPSHENGGMPISLPEGTEIYSKRVKVDGVSMADRKTKREKKTMTLESLLEKNNTDALIKNSLNRTKVNNQVEEDSDNKIQDTIRQLLSGEENKFAGGGKVKPLNLTNSEYMSPAYGQYQEPSFNQFRNQVGLDEFGNPLPVDLSTLKTQDSSYITPKEVGTSMENFYKNSQVDSTTLENEPGFSDNLKGIVNNGATMGDALSIFGNMFQSNQIMKDIKNNRAGDTPNINAFKDYGKKGLETLDNTKEYVNQVRDEKLKDLELSKTSAIRRGRNSARSVNTMRALDLATEAGMNKSKGDTYSQFAQEMMNILGQQAGMENQKDQVVMQGEQGRDLADRQDRDNFFTQLTQGHKNQGMAISQTGADLNKIKERNVKGKSLNNMMDYVDMDINGNITVKPGAKLVGNKIILDNKDNTKEEEDYKKDLLALKKKYKKTK